MLSTRNQKPSVFIDYFSTENVESLTDLQEKIDDTFESVERAGMGWSKWAKMRSTDFLTKSSDNPLPLFFHSLFNIDAQIGNESTYKEHNIVLTGFLDRIGVFKVNKTTLFGSSTQGARYSVLDILKAITDDQKVSIPPLQENEHPELKLSKAMEPRNAIAIPPLMADALIAVKDKSLANLLIAAVSAFNTSMFDSEETGSLYAQETEFDKVPEQLTSSTEAQIRARAEAKSQERSTLNKSWQQLGEKCGLQVVIYLLNFGSHTPIVMENAYKSTAVLREALTIISSRISGNYSAVPEEMDITADNTVMIDDSMPSLPASTNDPGAPASLATGPTPSPVPMLPPRPVNPVQVPQPPNPFPTQTNEYGVKRSAAPSFTPQDPFRSFRSHAIGASAFDDRINEMFYRGLAAKHDVRISENTQRSILHGASPCGHQPATDAPLTGVQILTSTSEAQAQIIIVQAMEAMNFPFYNLSSAQIKAMRSFALAWFPFQPPSGLSVFCNRIWCHDSNNNSELLIIDVKRDYNREITDQEISKLTTNHIVIPKSYMDTIRAMQTQLHLLKMFFGHDSLICSTYEDFITEIQRIGVAIERSIAVDDKFSTYLLLRVDSVVRKIVHHIVHSSEFNPQHFRALGEFTRILDEIENERFTCPMIPNWISPFEISKTKIETEAKKTPKKTPKGDDNPKKEMIRKESVVPRIKISDQEFDKHIKNKHLRSRPTACVRWHARGWCFAGCNTIKTHDKLSKKDEDEIFDFLVKVGIKK